MSLVYHRVLLPPFTMGQMVEVMGRVGDKKNKHHPVSIHVDQNSNVGETKTV